GCSWVETPLFEGMLVAREPEEQGDAEEQGNDDNAAEEPVTAIDDEALDACAALARRVEHLEHDKVAQDLEIIKLKTRVKKLEKTNKGRKIDELDRDEGAVLMNKQEEIEKSMSAKRTSWNKFSSAMASAVICLSTVKQSNDVTRLQALVDKKKVVVTEAIIRDALHLGDAKKVDYLPNEDIFTTLARMGYEKPSTKLTFYKAFFSSQWKVGKGCLGVETPLFKGMSVAREPKNQGDAEEQGDVKEQGNDNNATEEPVTAVDDVTDQSIQSPTPLTPPPQLPQDIPSTSQVSQDLEIIKLKTRVKKLERANKVKTIKLRRLRKVGTSQRIESLDVTIMEDVSNQGRMIDESNKDEGAELMNEKDEKETEKVRVNPDDAKVEGRQADIYHIDMDHATKVLSMQEDEPEIQEAVEVVTIAKLITEVVAAVSKTVSVAAVVQADIPATQVNVVVVVTTAAPVKSKDKGKGIMVEEPKQMKKKKQVELDEAYARKLQEELNQDIDWEVAMDHVKQKPKENPYVQRFTLDYFKGMYYDDIRPIFKAKFNANMEFLLKSKEQMEEEESRAIAIINETPAQITAKRRRLNKEAEDVEELKQHLEIVPDEDDDVYIEATPLARKVPVVDYQIIHVNNKPRYNIIRATDIHHLYTSFITMLKNFDRDELETLWSIVKESFRVDAAMENKEKHQVFTAASEDISVARQKLMMLVTAAKKCC
nr:hypothetical protein [Tanacetum cinerariifolium]